MQKIIIWFKINWLKVLLILVFVALLFGLIVYLNYTFSSFQQLENYTKRQAAGQQAMYMPMMIFSQLLVLPFIFAMYYYIMTGAGAGTFKRTRAEKVNVKWDEVIGMEEAKKDAWEVIRLLKDHTMRKAAGGIIKGTLMIGPPGCGKTYLAKAIATECGLPIISASGSDFVAMFMGQGAARMKSLFKQAREEARIHNGCVIFIDEIDAFARERSSTNKLPALSSADTSHNATINQFLTEMDGLGKKDNNIIIIAATNVNEEELDPAIMRSGRFDRKIRIEKPNAKERALLLKYYLAKVQADPTLDIDYFAEKAKWFSASDISNLIREASVIALRNNPPTINKDHMQTAISRIHESLEKIGGDKILSDKVNVKWAEVIGMENAKKEAWEVVDLLKDRNKLKAVGGKIVKGVIMFGPPGCGKTYLAKAMATEVGFPFISRTGSEFVRMWVGEGARKIEETFKEARKMARAEGGCIIFIDEIDACAQARHTDSGFGGTSSMNATTNALLTEMDGLRHAENNIVVLAATNVSEGMLDSALLRPGRFDRKIYVTLPNLIERKALFKFYLEKVTHEPTIDPDILAQKTLWFSPAQIDSMVREAGIFALREKREIISFKDLSNAYDRIAYGDKSNIIMTQKEKIWTAYHEAGHAIIGYLLHPTDDVIKATIIPRKGALGFVARRPWEEHHSSDKETLLADIKVMIAAYVAERIKFGSTSTGVGGGPGADFHSAMRVAHGMVTSLGMGKSGLIGDFSYLTNYNGTFNISERTRQMIDDDIQDILQMCIKDVQEILTKNNELFETFAQELLKREELEYDEIVAIFDRFGIKPASRKI